MAPMPFDTLGRFDARIGLQPAQRIGALRVIGAAQNQAVPTAAGGRDVARLDTAQPGRAGRKVGIRCSR
jgi:hypothetical protein